MKTENTNTPSKKYTKAQYVTYCALFCALGALLPQAFHAFGALSGTVFLPMHIPAMMAGFLLGPVAGVVTGIISPILSCLITGGGMPIPVKVPFCGFIYRAFTRTPLPEIAKTVFTVLTAQFAGRCVNILCTVFAVNVLGVTHKAVSLAAAVGSIGTGLPGIVIQLLFLPALMVTLKRIHLHREHRN